MTQQVIRCREGLADYDVAVPGRGDDLPLGLTAVLRVRNEARNLPWVLPPLLRSVDRVVLVDNESTDDTVLVARREAARAGTPEKLAVRHYPFAVHRCGPEHLATPPDSVHSLTHFYNWSFAQVGTSHSMKWDGDMVLTREGLAVISDLGWQLSRSRAVVAVPHPPLYVESDRVAYLDTKLRNLEPWILPTARGFGHVKGFDWEVRSYPPGTERIVLPQGLCFELKWLDSDEFEHWTSQDDFHSGRTPRKVRELAVFEALRAGGHAGLEYVRRIESPDERHVIDYVAEEWMAAVRGPLRRP